MNQERIETIKEVFLNPEAIQFLKAENFKHFTKVSPKEARVVFTDKTIRRNIKKVMKKEIEARTWEGELKHEDLINYWVNVSEDGESRNHAWIIKGDLEHAKKVLDQLGQPWEGVRINSIYDCTGQWFAYEANFTQVADRVFVTQYWGLDV